MLETAGRSEVSGVHFVEGKYRLHRQAEEALSRHCDVTSCENRSRSTSFRVSVSRAVGALPLATELLSTGIEQLYVTEVGN